MIFQRKKRVKEGWGLTRWKLRSVSEGRGMSKVMARMLLLVNSAVSLGNNRLCSSSNRSSGSIAIKKECEARGTHKRERMMLMILRNFVNWIGEFFVFVLFSFGGSTRSEPVAAG